MKEKNVKLLWRLIYIAIIGVVLLITAQYHSFYALKAGVVIFAVFILVGILRWAFMIVERNVLLEDIKDELKKSNNMIHNLVILLSTLEETTRKSIK